MIDTDKYEAAICGPMWAQQYGDVVKLVYPDWGGPSKNQPYIHASDALTAEQHLITDAPLLLEEVKRLREQIVDMIDSMDNYYIRDIQHATDCLRDMIGYYEDEEE
jgi:hypothetical protein